MTSRSLFRVVLAVALFVLIYAGIVLWAYCYHYSWYTPIKDAIPLVRGLPTHPQRAHDLGLPGTARKQPRGLEAARFQPGDIPTSLSCRGHASAWHRKPMKTISLFHESH